MKEAQYTKSITLALQPKIYEKIKEITDRDRISMAEWFRNAVVEALEKIEEGNIQN